MENFYFITFLPSYFSFFSFKLIFFGLSNQMVVAFKEENTIAFKHLFLKGYVEQMDDTYAVYTQSDVYDRIVFAVNQVNQVCAYFLGGEKFNQRIVASIHNRNWHSSVQGWTLKWNI